MDRIKLSVVVPMGSYIGHPYWPEKDDLINIHKKSGFNRARTPNTKEKALKGYLDSIGMTMDDYQELKKLAERQWYRQDNVDQTSEIVIPRHQISGCLVQAINNSPSAVRGPYKADTVRVVLQISDFGTGKFEADEVFDRFVKLEQSNQRSRQTNEVIVDFDAGGFIHAERPFTNKDLKDLVRLLNYAFKNAGVGASRKMGYGRRSGEVSVEPVGSLDRG